MSLNIVQIPTIISIFLTVVVKLSAFFTLSVSLEFGKTTTWGWSWNAFKSIFFGSRLIVEYPFLAFVSAQ
jgi:hypothetical protein